MENRFVTAVLGILFVGIAVAILRFAEPGWPTYVAALAVGGLGLDACVAALRRQRALLSRIGPLP